MSRGNHEHQLLGCEIARKLGLWSAIAGEVGAAGSCALDGFIDRHLASLRDRFRYIIENQLSRSTEPNIAPMDGQWAGRREPFLRVIGLCIHTSILHATGVELIVASAKRLSRLLVPAATSIFFAWALLSTHLVWYAEAGSITRSTWLQTAANVKVGADFHLSAAMAIKQTALIFLTPHPNGWLNTNLWTMHCKLFVSLLCFALVWSYQGLQRNKLARCVAGLVICLPPLLILRVRALPFVLCAALAKVSKTNLLTLSGYGMPCWLAWGYCFAALRRTHP